MDWLTKSLAGICVVLVIGLLLILHLYGGLKDNYQLLSSQFAEQVAINKDYKSRIQSLHELDTMYTQELTNAKTEIDSLRDAVKSGAKRLSIKAECPKVGTNTAEIGRDESSPRLSEATEQDYWRLREMMAENEKQTLYLQDYIRTECLR
ncbi:lysis protein [Morganella morganii]|uniref:lysis protein n=1 Tax=Morganella morganii TaxID=582 RepID=UPI000D1FCE34|nr:lysis protein [Morganella morganii]QXO44194.1 lysis protein [Morganella morganii]QXO47786.1 lysis protein [Morganella morganii]QXO51575.1 lysis protein [Morganella morganii]QXO55441.1 lysis protein [Morganella morganii]QXO82039.1 lysis protein [Morganella morganii]